MCTDLELFSERRKGLFLLHQWCCACGDDDFRYFVKDAVVLNTQDRVNKAVDDEGHSDFSKEERYLPS